MANHDGITFMQSCYSRVIIWDWKQVSIPMKGQRSTRKMLTGEWQQLGLLRVFLLAVFCMRKGIRKMLRKNLWSPLPCQLQVMQHEVSKDTAALLLNVGVLSQGQALRDHSLLHIELKAKVRLTPLSLLFSFSVLQWLHLHVASLCTCMRLTQSSITINQSHFLCGS